MYLFPIAVLRFINNAETFRQFGSVRFGSVRCIRDTISLAKINVHINGLLNSIPILVYKNAPAQLFDTIFITIQFIRRPRNDNLTSMANTGKIISTVLYSYDEQRKYYYQHAKIMFVIGTSMLVQHPLI